jgi:transposase
MNKRFIVTLTVEERGRLSEMIAAGTAAARKLTHARVLLKADQADGGAGWSDEEIAEALEVGLSMVARVRRRFVEEGLEAALVRKPQVRPSRLPKLDGRGEARLVATACSEPPSGRQRWTLRLLADRMVALGVVESLSHETVRQTLKKTS